MSAYSELYGEVSASDMKVLEEHLGSAVASSAWGEFAEHMFMVLLKAPEFADKSRIAEVVSQALEAMSRNLGGQNVYLPLMYSVKEGRRDAEIVRRFDGRNHKELGAEFGVSERHIYRILKRAKQTERVRRARLVAKGVQVESE